VKIHCTYDKIVPLHELKKHPKNRNQHPPDQIRLLAKLMKQHGWRVAITVSKQSGFIVRGHARLLAAVEAGFTEAPVDYQDYDSDEMELADLIADNRIADLAEIDEEALSGDLAELKATDLDLELTGFTVKELDEILNNDEPPGLDPAAPSSNITFKVIVYCETEAAQIDLIQQLEDVGYSCKAVSKS